MSYRLKNWNWHTDGYSYLVGDAPHSCVLFFLITTFSQRLTTQDWNSNSMLFLGILSVIILLQTHISLGLNICTSIWNENKFVWLHTLRRIISSIYAHVCNCWKLSALYGWSEWNQLQNSLNVFNCTLRSHRTGYFEGSWRAIFLANRTTVWEKNVPTTFLGCVIVNKILRLVTWIFSYQ